MVCPCTLQYNLHTPGGSSEPWSGGPELQLHVFFFSSLTVFLITQQIITHSTDDRSEIVRTVFQKRSSGFLFLVHFFKGRLEGGLFYFCQCFV